METILNPDVAPVVDPDVAPVIDPVLPEGVNSIYGDLEVKWPEGFEEGLKNDPSLKPFVDQEGNISYNNVMKSYVHGKKQFGKEKIVLPTDKSSKEEIDEFYSKLNGYDPVIENYKVEVDAEKSSLDGEFIEGIRNFAHENRLSPAIAAKLHGFLSDRVEVDTESETAELQRIQEESFTALKKEWGGAYDSRVVAAKEVIAEYFSEDEQLMAAFEDPAVGDNPVVLKILGTIGAKLFKEVTFGGEGNTSMTPNDVERQIAAIMGDSSHAYHNANHAEHKHASADMMKLYELRAKHRK